MSKSKKVFHVNFTGETGECNAQYNCPFGIPVSQHFVTRKEAEGFYENLMKSAPIPTMRSKRTPTPSTPVALGSVMDLDLLKKMRDQRFVNNRRHHDEDTMQVLCYTPMAQVAGKWNPVTKLARGLIVQSSKDDFSDAVIVQRPWEKFYTLSQIENGWNLGDEENAGSAGDVLSKLDFEAPAEVTDKLDGSMLVLYRDVNGNPAVATKGSFHSEPADMFSKMILDDDKMASEMDGLLKKHDDTTFVFEGVGPDNRIVLSYDKNDIRMIGAIRKHDGLYRSTSDYTDEWSFDRAESMPARNLREAFELPAREGKEGMVVRILSDKPENQYQIKIKQEDYLELHRTFASVTKKSVFNLLASGDFEEKEKEYSGFAAEKFNRIKNGIMDVYNAKRKEVEEDAKSVDFTIENQKDFAASIKGKRNMYFFFQMRQGEEYFNNMLWDYTKKNIKDMK